MTTAIVLGAAVRPDGTASPTLRLRVEYGVMLFHEGRVARLCLTGGQGEHGAPEAHVAQALALDLGVPVDALTVEDRSRSTFENLVFSRPLVEGPLILVSNRWHLPRAWLIARLLGLRVGVSGPKATAPFHRTAAATLREVAATPKSALRAARWARRNAP